MSPGTQPPVGRPQTLPTRRGRRRPVAQVWAVLVVVLALGGVLLGRLAQVQVLDVPVAGIPDVGEDTRTLYDPAVRGRILDADGGTLAGNAAGVVLTLDPSVLVTSEDEGRGVVEDVARALELPEDQLWGRTRVCGTADAPPVPLCFSGSPQAPVPLAYDVDPVDALAVLERPERFPGIDVLTTPVRSYPRLDDPAPINAAHLLGYLGAPTGEEVTAAAEADTPLPPEDLLGRAGLEEVYDAELRGDPGRTVVSIDPRGVVTGEVERDEPVTGADLLTHLDPEIQASVEAALADAVAGARDDGLRASAATAVVLDPRDGAVLASASLPTYDPNVWTGGIDPQDYAQLTDPDGSQPLLNRVVSATYPPASTYKVVTLPAAVSQGMDTDASYSCPGAVEIAGQTFTNFESVAYGEIDLVEALEVSCDTVFYQWAYESWLDQGGLEAESDLGDPFIALSESFRVGEPTGVDLPDEVPGRIPGREWKRETWEATREQSCERAETGYPEIEDEERREFLEAFAEENCVDGWQFRPGDQVNFSIGQGDLATTPLRIASVYAALANGGTLWQPQVADRVQRADGTLVREIDPVAEGEVSLAPDVEEVLADGLRGVMTGNGTAAGAFAGFPLEEFPLAGKTGSAEVFGQNPISWFVSYGPLPDPRYVVLVMVTESSTGAEIATPAAREIWEDVVAGDDGEDTTDPADTD